MTKIIYFFIFVLMDESLIYIIILVVIYLIRFFLKSKEEVPRTHIPEDHENMEIPEGPRRPSTFEELLREMGRKGYEEEEAEIAENQPEYETLEDPYYQYKPERDAEARSVYEKSVSQAKKFKTIDEQVYIENIEVKIDEPIGRKKTVVSSKYARMMRNPENLKDAIIMSELLKRKYD
jgi:hypothetical protein